MSSDYLTFFLQTNKSMQKSVVLRAIIIRLKINEPFPIKKHTFIFFIYFYAVKMYQYIFERLEK